MYTFEETEEHYYSNHRLGTIFEAMCMELMGVNSVVLILFLILNSLEIETYNNI